MTTASVTAPATAPEMSSGAIGLYTVIYYPDRLGSVGGRTITGPTRYQAIASTKGKNSPVEMVEMPFLVPGSNHFKPVDEIDRLKASPGFMRHLRLGVYEIMEPLSGVEVGTGLSDEYSERDAVAMARVSGDSEWLSRSFNKDVRPEVRTALQQRIEANQIELDQASQSVQS